MSPEIYGKLAGQLLRNPLHKIGKKKNEKETEE